MADWGGGYYGSDSPRPFTQEQQARRDAQTRGQPALGWGDQGDDAFNAWANGIEGTFGSGKFRGNETGNKAWNMWAGGGGGQQDWSNAMNPFAGMGGGGGNWSAYDVDPYGLTGGYDPFAGAGIAGVMQGVNTMQNLPTAMASQFGWANALNSANQQAYNQVAAPIDIARGNNATELAKTKMLTDTALAQQNNQMPLLQALIQGLSGNLGGGMTGFQNTASKQMAELPTGSSAKPVNFR
jgi:hypothetical protein